MRKLNFINLFKNHYSYSVIQPLNTVVIFILLFNIGLNAQNCPDYENTYDHSSPVTVYVNFHFILDGNGQGNYRSEDDGDGDDTWTGRQFAHKIVNDANSTLANLQSHVSNDCEGEPVPYVQNANVRFEIYWESGDPNQGVYFRPDQTLYDIVRGPTGYREFAELKKKYSQYGNTVMDVFVFAWDKTNDYLVRGEPEHLGTVQNIWNAWKKYMNEGKPKNLDYSGIFMHEAGHMFNLLQEAQSSMCDDYELDPIEEGLIGNNIMRNNGGAANALTPKQYSIIHDYLPKAPYTKYPACDIAYSPIIIQTGVETI